MGDAQTRTCKFALLLVAALLRQTVDCPPAVGSRNRWTLSDSWARQANKPASGYCWLMQNLPLVNPSFLSGLLRWKWLLENYCVAQAASVQCTVQYMQNGTRSARLILLDFYFAKIPHVWFSPVTLKRSSEHCVFICVSVFGAFMCMT